MSVWHKQFCGISARICCQLRTSGYSFDHRQPAGGNKEKMSESNSKAGLISEYIDVGTVETHVLKYGSIRSPESRQKEQQHLFLIVPGNPGIPEYYEEFMHTLWEKSGERIPVWCVGHAGHVTGPKHPTLGWTNIVQQPGQVYTLEGQISYKVNFIKDQIPPDVRLILVGHSIGCYIIMNILPQISQFHVTRCFMLFPTIERMAETPNGRLFTPTLNYCRWFIIGLVKVLSYFGPRVHRKMLQFHFSDGDVPECGVEASLHLFNPTCVSHATFMAKHEMAEVTERQEELLKKYIDKMSFYYGAVDSWCPKDYCYAMQSQFPEADIRLCQMDFSHAFVLDAGEEMAHTVYDWVQDHL